MRAGAGYGDVRVGESRSRRAKGIISRSGKALFRSVVAAGRQHVAGEGLDVGGAHRVDLAGVDVDLAGIDAVDGEGAEDPGQAIGGRQRPAILADQR